jgi:cystathionine beta-lyase
MHFGAPALKTRFFERIPSRLLGSPGVTGVDATIAAWDDGQPWLDEILAQLQANRDWLAQTIGTELPGVTMRLPEATYLAWLDCSALALPSPAGQFFLERARVGLNFGETFGAQYASFARLNFATPRPVLQEIVGRMAEAARRK